MRGGEGGEREGREGERRGGKRRGGGGGKGWDERVLCFMYTDKLLLFMN